MCKGDIEPLAMGLSAEISDAGCFAKPSSSSTYYRADIWEIRFTCSPYGQTLLCMSFELKFALPGISLLLVTVIDSLAVPVMALTGISCHPVSQRLNHSSPAPSCPLLPAYPAITLAVRTILYWCSHLPP